MSGAEWFVILLQLALFAAAGYGVFRVVRAGVAAGIRDARRDSDSGPSEG